MSTPTDTLDALVAAYVQAVEAGQIPDRQELLANHPDQAQALHAFFADFDRMDRVAAPLRMAGDPDETTPAEGDGPTRLPTLRYFGDYELLEEIARGGMGVVYKARQSSLNRLVALKMILAGTFASPREVARFQAEAEAAANLDHPHIVPVHEVGEHEGQQYFSMKFVEGGSLASHPRGEIKPEVLGLISIARAVHHAHQHGVLHRDLKPTNVLVDPKGGRHVTDFGLAKRLTDLDRSLTEAGQILGTPRYMSPEQAAGRKDLTVAADVYALGVILYERLTGHTPFDGETAMALLRQVRESEPPRPSSIRPGLDRDLETILLKCLEKDPTRRYATAEDLVEDLTRWLEGRPIAARPVGQGERFVRWCRRNPAVAGLTATVALILVLATVVSGFFALEQRKARVRAETAEDNTERAFARSLAWPLDPEGANNPDLSGPEIEALWELSSQDGRSLGLRFLEQSSRDPFALRQLCARSEPGLIAAIGFDEGRRDQATRPLVEHLRQPSIPLEDKVELAFLLIEMEDDRSPIGEEASRTLIGAFGEDLAPSLRKFMEAKVLNLCDSLPASRAATLIVAGLERATFQNEHFGRLLGAYSLATSLGSLATRLEPAEVAKLARSIVNSLDRVKDTDSQSKWVIALSSLSGRLEPDEATLLCGRAARSIAAFLKSTKLSGFRGGFAEPGRFAEALALLSARLGPDEARAIVGSFASSHERWEGIDIGDGWAEVLASLSGRLEPAEEAPLRLRIARSLAADIAGKIDLDSQVKRWSSTLGALTNRLNDPEAALLCGRAAQSLVERIVRGDSINLPDGLVEALGSLAPRLKPGDALGLARSIAAALERASIYDSPQRLAKVLLILSDRLDPDEASSLCGKPARNMAETIENAKDTDTAWSEGAEALASLSGRLEPAEAKSLCGRAARAIAGRIERDSEPYARSHSAESLALLSARIDPSEATALCGRAARSIADSFGMIEDPSARYNLAVRLAFLVPRLAPADAARVFRTGAGHFERETNPFNRYGWARTLQAMSDRLQLPDFDRKLAYELYARSIDRDMKPFLSSATAPHQNQDAARIGATILQFGLGGSLDRIIQDAIGPEPCRLTTPELVEILKMPTCFGPCRRAVLDQLEHIHKRQFANHREFARFAREAGLELDFASPPRRPDPKKSLGRLLDGPNPGR